MSVGAFLFSGYKNFLKKQKNIFQLAKTLRVDLVEYAQKINEGDKQNRVTAEERRRAILEVICARRHETRENLAFEFGVSKRTIEYDVLRLSQSYPIYTTQGTGGGIHVMDGYRLDGKYLTDIERCLLERIGVGLSISERAVIEGIVKKFSVPTKKEVGK